MTAPLWRENLSCQQAGNIEPIYRSNTVIPNTLQVPNILHLHTMAEQVQQDIFDPPCHKLKTGIQSKLETLLKEYETQFAKDETSIGTTPLTEMTINTGNSEPISQKPYPIAMKNYQWVKGRNRKTTHSEGHMQQQVKLVSTHNCSPKRRWSKMISHQLQSIKQGH